MNLLRRFRRKKQMVLLSRQELYTIDNSVLKHVDGHVVGTVLHGDDARIEVKDGTVAPAVQR